MKRKSYIICLLFLSVMVSLAGCTKENSGKSKNSVKVKYNVDTGFLEADGVSYQIDNNNAAVAGHCDLDIENLNIPDKINYENKDYPVTKIISSAFESDLSLISFTAGSNITEIEDNAFYSCDTLETVNLNNTVQKIGKDAFGGCSLLKEVKGVGALTSISEHAFSNCYSLEYFFISKTVESMGTEIFSDCEALKECKLEEGLSFIGQGMFTNCVNLSEVSLPKSITTINE